MAAKAIQVEDSVMEALIELFRTHGYQGTSLSQIMSATGLVKASLYHRFSGGKQQMALAVIDHVAQIFAQHILAPLQEPGDPRKRLAETVKRLRTFYAAGAKACLLETMSLAVSRAIRTRARRALDYWVDALAAFAKANGVPAALAAARAEEAVVSIEGALVLARLSGDRRIFERVLQRMPAELLEA